MLYTIIALAGKPYRPANGTEGDFFHEWFCDRCRYESTCALLLASMLYQIDDPEYPKEWKHNEKGQPVCTMFEQN